MSFLRYFSRIGASLSVLLRRGMLGGRLDGLLLDGLLGSLLGSSLRCGRSLGRLEVDFSTTTAMISGERSVAVGALVMYILE